MSKQIISKDKQYQTRDGRKVVILADNIPNTMYPVVGYVVDKNDSYYYQWTDTGNFYANVEHDDILDLIPAPPVTVEYAALWDNGKRFTRCSFREFKDKEFPDTIGHMVRTTEEGKPPVYHFEPI